MSKEIPCIICGTPVGSDHDEKAGQCPVAGGETYFDKEYREWLVWQGFDPATTTLRARDLAQDLQYELSSAGYDLAKDDEVMAAGKLALQIEWLNDFDNRRYDAEEKQS